MSHKPTAETEVKSLRREVKRLKAELADARASANEYRPRASRAEAEVSEWKKRFDLLLKREPLPPVATSVRLSADDLHDLAQHR
jgi:hypothetical protein